MPRDPTQSDPEVLDPPHLWPLTSGTCVLQDKTPEPCSTGAVTRQSPAGPLGCVKDPKPGEQMAALRQLYLGSRRSALPELPDPILTLGLWGWKGGSQRPDIAHHPGTPGAPQGQQGGVERGEEDRGEEASHRKDTKESLKECELPDSPTVRTAHSHCHKAWVQSPLSGS